MPDSANEPDIEPDNPEQDDEPSQAQTLASEALRRASSGIGDLESEKVRTGPDDDGTQDLVDRMKQMESSGRIDMSAYAGERNDDDEDETYGSATEDE
ncbi:hypothetical protein H7F51_06110 [Novosphingobium flavum]|uniref:Uncharacterized protein n=1 Tax=Novosphingobium flavum TaxID=1778672 RepID=A0A7X1KL05_9SPHN|nr:hypothetical protein [Novosphingobium flavum]MBC2665084.1 hypothetical protein [Novosphingobium flavum]